MAASAMTYSLSARAFASTCDPDVCEAPDDARRRLGAQAPFAPQPTRADADRAQMDNADAWGVCQMFIVPADGDGDGARGTGPHEWPPPRRPTALAAAPAWPPRRQTPLATGAQVGPIAAKAWLWQTPLATEARAGAIAANAWPGQLPLATEARVGAITAQAMEALAAAAYTRSLQTRFTTEARAAAIAAAAMEALAARVAARGAARGTARGAARGARRAKPMDGAGHSAPVATLAGASGPRAPGRTDTHAHRDTADRDTVEWAAAMAAQRNR